MGEGMRAYFKNNMRNGFGVMIYQDRQGNMKRAVAMKESVNFRDDERNGQGIMIYSNDGRRLKGEFKDVQNVFINYN